MQNARDSVVVFGSARRGFRSQYAYWTRSGGADVAHVCGDCDVQLAGVSSGDFDLFLGPESENIEIEIDPAVGYTTAAGLRFEDSATLAVRIDGTIRVDSDGVRASDSRGVNWVSRKVRVYDEDIYLMVKDQESQPPR